eukprot:2755661-Prymnesium_polylepis.1
MRAPGAAPHVPPHAERRARLPRRRERRCLPSQPAGARRGRARLYAAGAQGAAHGERQPAPGTGVPGRMTRDRSNGLRLLYPRPPV